MATKVIATKTDESGTVVTTQQKVRVWMQVFVSVVLLGAGICVLVSPNFIHHNIDEGIKKIAAGWIGAVVGYWLS
jgi:hypothetical protein